MSNVFISYSSADKAFARKLGASLGLAGVDVWLDERKLQVGDSIIKELGNAISGSDFVIAVLSRSSVRSAWVEKELSLAMTEEQHRRKKIVLPVKIDNCDPPAFLRDKLYADFSEPSTFNEVLSRLLAAISIEEDRCSYCGSEIPLSFDRCPHCGRSSDAPNVRAARSKVERDALHARYIQAVDLAESRGYLDLLQQFEAAAWRAKVVMQCSVGALERLAATDNSVFRAYFEVMDSDRQEHHDARWPRLRRLADEALFPLHGKDIRYGVLSLANAGLSAFGDCSLVLREEMIAHRTSLFEVNSVLFAQRHHYKIPAGHRAAWQDRGKLCAAKLAPRMVDVNLSPGDFAGLMLREGNRPNDDDFIEAHVWGPISIRTVERVTVRIAQAKPAWIPLLVRKLGQHGIEVDVS